MLLQLGPMWLDVCGSEGRTRTEGCILESGWGIGGLMTVTILIVPSLVAASATATADLEPTDAAPRFRMNLQFGLHMRLVNSTDDPFGAGSGMMISASLVGLKWDRRHATWGVGIRGVNDSISRRLECTAACRNTDQQ